MAARRRSSKLERKLDTILSTERAVLRREEEIERDEKQDRKEERRIEALETSALSELKELERIEKDIEEQVKSHPLTKIGARDLVRGLVGAFIGVIIHNALYYGTHIADTFDTTRTIIWFCLSFIVGGILLYATGYRQVKDKAALWFLPVRLIILYTAALIVSVAALFLYLPDFGTNMSEAIKLVAAVQMSAIIGAITADLLGRD